MKFKTTPVKIPLYGHALTHLGMLANEPKVTGTFCADPVIGTDERAYGVFTIPDDNPYTSSWAGTYRIDAERLRLTCPDVFVEG